MLDDAMVEMIQNNLPKNSKKKKKSVANIVGNSDVYKFDIEIKGNIKNFDFLKVNHFEYGPVLCQVYNIARVKNNKMIGNCRVIGYKQEHQIKPIRKPFLDTDYIEIANDYFIEDVIGLNKFQGAYIGTLKYHDKLGVTLNLGEILKRHISILASTGAGKSYTVGVMLEEIIKQKIPVLILDPHNEYHTLTTSNTKTEDVEGLKKHKLKPIEFKNIVEWTPDDEVNTRANKIQLDMNQIKPQDLIDMFPNNITPTQQSLIYSILSSLNNRVNFDELIFNISNEENNSKWTLITQIEEIKKLKLFSKNPTPLKDIVNYNQCSILSLKGIDKNTQSIVVTQLLKQLFDARKKGMIPPFFLVCEEAHNFLPEKGFGKNKCSTILRDIAGEGRKFGIGMCVISQRPAKIDKNVISQCGTQIIMKLTNSNDMKAVLNSSEGLENSFANEIKQLEIGSCIIAGVIDMPLKVDIRPRQTKHGGESINFK